MVCSKCGKELLERQIFCDACGEPVLSRVPAAEHQSHNRKENLLTRKTQQESKPARSGKITVADPIKKAVLILGCLAAAVFAFILLRALWKAFVEVLFEPLLRVLTVVSTIGVLICLLSRIDSKNKRKNGKYLAGFGAVLFVCILL